MPRHLILLLVVIANVILAGVLLTRDRPRVTHEPPPPPEFDQPIRLVDEADTGVAAADEQAQGREAHASAGAGRECRVWGPVDDQADLAALRERLEATGGFPEIRSTSIAAEPDFLVYLDALGTRDQARRVTQELAALNIESYLLTRDTGPIVSVGVFSQEPRAVRQQQRLSQLGYQVVIEPMPRAREVYVLTAHVAPSSAEYESSTSPCKTFAQSNEFL